MSKWSANAFLPSFLTSHGTLGRVYASATKDPKKDMSWSDAMLSAMGFTTHTLNPETQKFLNKSANAELDKAFRAVAMDASPKEFKEYQKEYLDAKEKLNPYFTHPKGATPEQYRQYLRYTPKEFLQLDPRRRGLLPVGDYPGESEDLVPSAIPSRGPLPQDNQIDGE